MSVHISSHVWRNAPKIDPTALLVLLALADQANDEGVSWYATTSIAKRCRISDRQARTWLDRLAEMGLIEVTERPGRTHLIRVLTPAGDFTPAEDFTPETPRNPTPAEDFKTPLRRTSNEPSITVKGTVKGGRAKRVAHRLPDGYTPTDEMRAWAATEIPASQVDRETEKFIDHYQGNGKPMKDWDAAWRNWIRKCRDYGQSNVKEFRPATPRPKCPEHPRMTQPCATCAAERAAGLRKDPA